MIYLYLLFIVPILGIFIMTLYGHHRYAGILNILLTIVTFMITLFLAHFVSLSGGHLLAVHQQIYLDAFSIIFILLTTFIFMTAAFFSRTYMWHNVESNRISTQQLKLYHVMFQLFELMLLLTFVSNNIGLLWVAMEGSTLATVLLVSLYRTPEAIEAAWKYFILCIVGIALALLGTILIYASAAPIITPHESAILWNVLNQSASQLDANTVRLAFVFLMVGYGTKIGLVPFHHWLPDAYSESPAPVSTLLSGLLLNAALYALLRFKIIVDGALLNHFAGNFMIGFGLLSFIVAALLIHRQRNIKRMFAYSSIEHIGLITAGFGFGAPLSTWSALFYLIVHALNKSAIFMTLGNIIQLTGTQTIEKIRGLISTQPLLAWLLLLNSIAICGLPPFGIFTGELLLILAILKQHIWIIPFIILGSVIALSGIFKHVQPMIFGQPTEIQKIKINTAPIVLHLILVTILSIYLPSILSTLLQQATSIMGVMT